MLVGVVNVENKLENAMAVDQWKVDCCEKPAPQNHEDGEHLQNCGKFRIISNSFLVLKVLCSNLLTNKCTVKRFLVRQLHTLLPT